MTRMQLVSREVAHLANLRHLPSPNSYRRRPMTIQTLTCPLNRSQTMMSNERICGDSSDCYCCCCCCCFGPRMWIV